MYRISPGEITQRNVATFLPDSRAFPFSPPRSHARWVLSNYPTALARLLFHFSRLRHIVPRGQGAPGRNNKFPSLLLSLFLSLFLFPRHPTLIPAFLYMCHRLRAVPHLVASAVEERSEKETGRECLNSRERRREIADATETEKERERERETKLVWETPRRSPRNWNVLYTPIRQKERRCSSSVILGVRGRHRGYICNPTEHKMTSVPR